MSFQKLLDALIAPSGERDTDVHLPFTHLCGLDIDIYFSNVHGLGRIYTRMYTGYETKSLQVPTHPLTLEGLGLAIAQLDTIKFSKKLDQFYVGDPPPDYSDLFVGTNYTHLFHECAVCLDVTKRKTSCNHSLCLECDLKLANRSCPLCRGSLG